MSWKNSDALVGLALVVAATATSTNAFAQTLTAGPVAQDASVTVTLNASLDSEITLTITGRGGDPFTGAPNGVLGEVDFGAVSLSAGDATPPPSTTQVLYPGQGSVALIAQLTANVYYTGFANAELNISGNQPSTEAEARWQCGTPDWALATAGTALEITPLTACQTFTGTSGLTNNDAVVDVALYLPSTTSSGAHSASFVLTATGL